MTIDCDCLCILCDNNIINGGSVCASFILLFCALLSSLMTWRRQAEKWNWDWRAGGVAGSVRCLMKFQMKWTHTGNYWLFSNNTTRHHFNFWFFFFFNFSTSMYFLWWCVFLFACLFVCSSAGAMWKRFPIKWASSLLVDCGFMQNREFNKTASLLSSSSSSSFPTVSDGLCGLLDVSIDLKGNTLCCMHFGLIGLRVETRGDRKNLMLIEKLEKSDWISVMKLRFCPGICSCLWKYHSLGLWWKFSGPMEIWCWAELKCVTKCLWSNTFHCNMKISNDLFQYCTFGITIIIEAAQKIRCDSNSVVVGQILYGFCNMMEKWKTQDYVLYLCTIEKNTTKTKTVCCLKHDFYAHIVILLSFHSVGTLSTHRLVYFSNEERKNYCSN